MRFLHCVHILLLLATTAAPLAEANITELQCDRNQKGFAACLTNYINEVLELIQSGKAPELATLNPESVSEMVFKPVILRNVSLFFTLIQASQVNIGKGNQLGIKVHIGLVIIDSTFEMETIINKKLIAAKGHAIHTLGNVTLMYRTHLIKKLINGRSILQLAPVTNSNSCDYILMGLAEVTTDAGPLSFEDELLLKKQYSTYSEQLLEQFSYGGNRFIYNVGNKVLAKLALQ